MALAIRRLDYRAPGDAVTLVTLLDAYARDPMGGGAPLDDAVRATLAERLAEVPGAFSLVAEDKGEAVGLANCFTGFSTFAARPLVNIHDLVVVAASRGKGIARALIGEIERIAAGMGACKVTLEVLSGNERAKALYASLGYGDYALDPATGRALFWQKRLVA